MELQSTGSIKIIDRKKNIFKLSQGEYVAVEKIENILQQASTVNQIWVYGDSHQRFLVAIIYPNHHSLAHLSEGGTSITSICGSEAVKKAVLHELTEVGKSGGLKGFERVHDIALVPDEFTIENGLMTPSSKLKRHELLRRYKTTIDALYAES